MAWQVWLFIALIMFSLYQYVYPDSSQKLMDSAPFLKDAKTKILGGIGGTKDTPAPTPGAECPDTDAPMCGSDGKTYKNACVAAYNDILQVTQGACP